eukprot:TRINITY_DN7610_c0_g1_i1.p1 TRINITY_DN7610_c0_g1~~TRINITY_DN7610_c0_g1_i1.p1  ORF type:complete len:530 (-),score=94.84 TRINITY_DN7610_c0_g1_i1:60-1649(-)
MSGVEDLRKKRESLRLAREDRLKRLKTEDPPKTEPQPEKGLREERGRTREVHDSNMARNRGGLSASFGARPEPTGHPHFTQNYPVRGNDGDFRRRGGLTRSQPLRGPVPAGRGQGPRGPVHEDDQHSFGPPHNHFQPPTPLPFNKFSGAPTPYTEPNLTPLPSETDPHFPFRAGEGDGVHPGRGGFRGRGRGRGGKGRDGRDKTDIPEEIANDYSQHFVDTGERPQNFVRDSAMQDRFEEYPSLRTLLEKKDELIQLRNTPPFYLQQDLKTFDLSQLGAQFDVIIVDPPWKEYYLRSGKTDTGAETPFWSLEDIENLNIPAVASTPSFLFLWSGSGGDILDWGRRLLCKWGYRRSEDIVWVKTNKDNTQANLNAAREESTFVRTKEHCLMGIKGSVRRNVDAHFIHTNVDTDVIISEEPELGSTKKPDELYHIIENFCLGRRRLELFGEDHNIRPGWVTIGNKISSSNFDSALYNSYFEPSEQNGHLLGTTKEIEGLRPRSPTRDDTKLIFYDPNKKVSNRGPPDKDVD